VEPVEPLASTGPIPPCCHSVEKLRQVGIASSGRTSLAPLHLRFPNSDDKSDKMPSGEGSNEVLSLLSLVLVCAKFICNARPQA
jgi:hypothetical protein